MPQQMGPRVESKHGAGDPKQSTAHRLQKRVRWTFVWTWDASMLAHAHQYLQAAPLLLGACADLFSRLMTKTHQYL